MKESKVFQWSSVLETTIDDQDRLIMITQAEYGQDPSTMDIFDLATNPKLGTTDEAEEISIFIKDIPRVIRLLAEVLCSVQLGETIVKNFEFDDDEKEELK